MTANLIFHCDISHLHFSLQSLKFNFLVGSKIFSMSLALIQIVKFDRPEFLVLLISYNKERGKQRQVSCLKNSQTLKFQIAL